MQSQCKSTGIVLIWSTIYVDILSSWYAENEYHNVIQSESKYITIVLSRHIITPATATRDRCSITGNI